MSKVKGATLSATIQPEIEDRGVYELHHETKDDWWEVEALYDLCFAPGREALSSYRLRDDVPPVPELCLVARDADGILAGAIRFWPVRVGAHRAVGAGWSRAMLVGDAPYYGRFAFRRLEDVDMPPPTNPERVLGIALTPGAWDGIKGRVRRDA